MATTFTIDQLNGHPMATYAKESVEARDEVVAEIDRLQDAAGDESITEAQRKAAQADLDELIALLGRMDEADRAFLARVVLGPFGPKDEVVQRTIELNANLGAVVARNNHAKAVIQLVSQWVDGLSAVVTGAAPSMPPATTPATPA